MFPLKCDWCDITLYKYKSAICHIAKAHGSGLWSIFWDKHLSKACLGCDKALKWRADGQHKSRKFCSLSCYNLSMWNRPYGSRNKNWKGGKWNTNNGYIMRAKTSFSEQDLEIVLPMFNKTKGVLEHRAVMALALGRTLSKEEQVHHKNGNRSDNRIENLEVWRGAHPAGINTLQCPSCKYCGRVKEFTPK